MKPGQLSPAVGDALLQAKAAAGKLGHADVRPAHLLEAMLADPAVRRPMGAAAIGLQRHASELTLQLPRGEGAGPTLSREVHTLLEEGIRLAGALGQNQVSTVHLLLAMMAPEAGFAEAFAQAGVSRRDLFSAATTPDRVVSRIEAFENECRGVLADAARMAKALLHARIRPAHLLAAMLVQQDTDEGLMDEVGGLLDGLPKDLVGEPLLSGEAVAVLDDAKRSAAARRLPAVTSDLLRAAVRRAPEVRALLERQDLVREDVPREDEGADELTSATSPSDRVDLLTALRHVHVDAGADALAETRRLGGILDSLGFSCEIVPAHGGRMDFPALAVTQGPDTHSVLVHVGDLHDLRRRFPVFLELFDLGPRHVVSAEPLPDDVRRLTGVGPLAELERVLTSLIWLDTPIAELERLAPALVPVFEHYLGVSISLDSADVLDALDAIVMRLRPSDDERPLKPGLACPNSSLLGVGVLAAEALQRRYGRARFTGSRADRDAVLADTRGIPPLSWGDVPVDVASAVRERWRQGSLVSLGPLGERVRSAGASSQGTHASGVPERMATVERVLWLARVHLRSAGDALRAGQEPSPLCFMNDSEDEVYTMDPGLAADLVLPSLAREVSRVHLRTVWDPSRGRTCGAIKVSASAGGTGVHVTVAIPYVLDPVVLDAPRLLRRDGIPSVMDDHEVLRALGGSPL